MTDHSALLNLVSQVDALQGVEVTNRCTDPAPADYLNWVGGTGGGTGIFGYAVSLDSTYAADGLHVLIDHGSAGFEGSISPNGDGFSVDPFDDPGNGDLGGDVKTYPITQDVTFSFSLRSTDSCQVDMVLYLYEADGTELSHTTSGSTYLSNYVETFAANAVRTFVTRVYYDALLAAFPTLDSIAFMPGVGGGVPGAQTWVGSCMAVDGSTVFPYRDYDSLGWAQNGDGTSTGRIDLDAVISWADVLGKPDVFPPTAHDQAISTITGLQAELDGRVESVTGAGVDNTDPQNPVISTPPATSALVPLTTVVGGVPELVWDANDELVLTEVPL